MDLLTYLEQRNELDLFDKMKELVNLHREKEMKRKYFFTLNQDYNETLTNMKNYIARQEEWKESIKTPIEKIGDMLKDKLSDFNPFIIIWLSILIPVDVLLIFILFSAPSFLLYFIQKRKRETIYQKLDEKLNEVKAMQTLAYEEVYKARTEYHTKRKEYESKISELTPKELEILESYCEIEDAFINYLETYSNLIEQQDILQTKENLQELAKTV